MFLTIHSLGSNINLILYITAMRQKCLCGCNTCSRESLSGYETLDALTYIFMLKQFDFIWTSNETSHYLSCYYMIVHFFTAKCFYSGLSENIFG